jgi:Holliday junction resolvase RusA-like endonuclease
MYKYTIPHLPKSLNHYAGRENQWAYRNEKKEWEMLVLAYCRPVPPQPLFGVVVRLTYYFPTNSRHDPDNYAGKMINDGLVRAGILLDDSFKCIQLVLHGDFDKKNPRTEIEIF